MRVGVGVDCPQVPFCDVSLRIDHVDGLDVFMWRLSGVKPARCHLNERQFESGRP